MSRCLIQFSHLFLSFDVVPIFDDVALSIHENEVFALIGENGAGKSTLLQLLTGAVLPDSGHFVRAPHLTIGLLPQEVILPTLEITAEEYLAEGPLSELERAMAACLEDLDRLTEWAELHERYEQLGGYRRMPVDNVVQGLKSAPLLHASMASLSSGQRVRVALAKALIQNPNLLLLDEPTNHLDGEMLAWLEQMLRKREGATVIVSHDRQFINRVANRLVEIKQGKLVYYGGNYDFYLQEQERLKEKQLKAFEAQEEERALLQQKIKAVTFSAPKASAPKDRNIMAYDRRGEQFQKSLQRNLDVLKARLAEIEENRLPHPHPKGVKGLRFSPELLRSSVAIEMEDVSKAFGEKVVFSGVTKRLCKGDRIVLTGPNGSGKTTLLRCIAGVLPVDRGEIRYAPSAKIAYLDQEVENLPMNQTPLHYFASKFHLSEEQLRRELHMAAIGGAELLGKTFSALSVGQRKRFMLLSIILEKPNVLLLDEPTNHLDFLTLEALETALLQFEGALLVVSHDAMFIEKIATEQWVF